MKLRDVLFGCPECGLDSCQCNDSVNGDHDQWLPPSQPSSPLGTLDPPQASTTSCPATPWTPPPTPPCDSCGGINFGPSPSDICFSCIPPLESKSQSNRSRSPSLTPPGTPQQLRVGRNLEQ